MKKLIIIILTLTSISCSTSNIITTPLRISSSIISVIPVVGDTTSDIIDSSANIIDEAASIADKITP